MTSVRGTATSRFGVGKREAHDSSEFYARFQPPRLSSDDQVAGGDLDGLLVCGDARSMPELATASVALVVTSPPYFAGKEYERALGEGHVPATYLEYLEMLRDVFAECRRVLEPGGRLAVNVANLGRKPYRSLASDVIRILQDDLHLLLRGEVVWLKARGATGSTAWGSYRSPSNPVLRDLTERVVVASKGRFERAKGRRERERLGLPHLSTVSADEFLEATLDVWEIAPESAGRVGHPAPFPVELPQRLIELYTYRGDLVLDPFLGSGTTSVAAVRTGRRYAGYDTDPDYLALAGRRLAEEGHPSPGPDGDHLARSAEDGLREAGFSLAPTSRRESLVIDLQGHDRQGGRWSFGVYGGFTVTRNGLARAEPAWKAVGRASLASAQGLGPVVLLTSHLPAPGSEADQALRRAGPGVVFDVIELGTPEARARLQAYGGGGAQAPLAGFWGIELG